MTRTKIRFAVTAVLVLGVLAATAARAQDSQYWTQQYGNQARLLGGAVVGGSNDLSATYYNPGRLALLETHKLLLAGNVFEYTSITVTGHNDDGGFKSSRLGSVPSLFAGMIGRPTGDDNRFAYSFFARQIADIRIDERSDLTNRGSYLSDLTTASYSLDEYTSEYWAGMSWSKPLSDHVGLGISGYVTVRSQRSRTLILAQTALDDLAGVAVQRRDFDYNHWGFVAKLGLGADLGDWQLGLTATSPKLKIWGSGNFGFDETIVTQDLDGDGQNVSQVMSDHQPDLNADYKWASSLALGVSRGWGATKVHLTSEWFAGVPAYTVMDLEPVTSSDGSITKDQDLTDVRNSVLNLGFGVEHAFRESLVGYAGVRTDFTSAEIGRTAQIAVSVWDIYHITGGATFRAFNSDFTLGMIYAFGGVTTPSDLGLVPETGESGSSDDQIVEVEFRRVTGLLGFAFGF